MLNLIKSIRINSFLIRPSIFILLLSTLSLSLVSCHSDDDTENTETNPTTNPMLVVSHKRLLKTGRAQSHKIDLYSNRPWRVVVPDSDTSWLKVVPNNGSALDKGIKVRLDFAPNEVDTLDRKTKIRIEQLSNDTTFHEIEVEQLTEYFTIQDSLALVEFYYAMDGPNWMVPWDLSKPMSHWGQDVEIFLGKSFDGVWLNKINRRRRVSSIWYWNANGLKGEIPECLGRMTALQGIGFHDDKGIVGQLPINALTNCNIERITVRNCGLSGTLSKDYSLLKKIDVMELDGNEITGIEDGFGDFPVAIGILLGGNKIEGELKPEFLDKMPNMIILDLSFNNFSGNLSPRILDNKKKLQMFGVCYNRLSGDFPAELRSTAVFHPDAFCPQQSGYSFTPGTCM